MNTSWVQKAYFQAELHISILVFFFFFEQTQTCSWVTNQCIIFSHWVNIMIKILLISLEIYTKHYIINKIIVEINYIILCMCISFWEKNTWKRLTIHPMIGYGQEWWSSRLLFITCYLNIWEKWCEKNCGSKLIYIYIYIYIGDSSLLPCFLKIFGNMPLFWNYIGSCLCFKTRFY